MDSVGVSLVPGLGDSEHPDGDWKIYVIVPPAQASLVDPLAKKFEGRGRVEVFVDRRRAERRTQHQVVSLDRRRADRRRQLEEMSQVAIGTKGSRPE
jgi:hypothetical protein